MNTDGVEVPQGNTGFSVSFLVVFTSLPYTFAAASTLRICLVETKLVVIQFGLYLLLQVQHGTREKAPRFLPPSSGSQAESGCWRGRTAVTGAFRKVDL